MRTLIYGGRVIDPAGRLDGEANILIEGGHIKAVGKEMYAADETIDASGKVVCPGFVDIHCHEDPVADGRIDFSPEYSVGTGMLRQGVTTAVCGNCGESKYSPSAYLDLVDRDGAPVNIAMLAAYEYYRFAAGASDRYAPASEEQISRITEAMKADLAKGCAGISYGIRYVPGMNGRELSQTMASLGQSGKPVACHIRDDAGGVFAALEEFMDAAALCGAKAQVSHIGSMAGFGQMEEFLKRIEAYRSSGIDVLCDCYPYSAFSTTIGSATYDDGWLDRYGCDYGVLELSEGKYKGQRCTGETFYEMRRDFPGCITVCYVMKSEDVELAFKSKNVMLASDATMDRGQGHPRAYGTFPRLISEYVRKGVLSLYDAVEKMTSMPADRFGFVSKGRLSPGADADIVIFDPETVRDNARFDAPLLAPDGIEYVLIGGRIAAVNSEILIPNLGRSVRT